MKKIILIMAIICQLCAYSQNIDDFKVVCDDLNIGTDSQMGDYLYPFEKYLYVTGTAPSSEFGNTVIKEQLLQINKLHNIKAYDYENSTNHPYMSEMPEGIFGQQIIWQSLKGVLKCNDEYWLALEIGGFFIFKEELDTDSITFTNYIKNGSSNCAVDPSEQYIYNVSSQDVYIINRTTRKIDHSILVSFGVNTYSDMLVDDNHIFWGRISPCSPYFFTYKKYIPLQFINNIADNINYIGDGNINIKRMLPYNENNSLKMFLLTLDKVDSSNKTLIIRKHPDGKFDTTITYPDKFHKNKLITHTTEAGFDSIPFSDARQMLEGTNAQFHQMYKWSDNEIALCGAAYGTKQDSSTTLIYNIDTKKWSKFVLPDFITPFGSTKNSLVSIAEWNNKHYFLTRDKLYVYEPNNSIEDEIEAGIIPDLWIRKVTPNPATSSVNVNIMYYPSGIYSNDLEVGLYNYMGEKIIDLTPLGTYTDHNHTWEATFDIPKRLASGMYFLNVRSGDESRTKGIAIY